MLNFIKDKYFLMCFAISFLILSTNIISNETFESDSKNTLDNETTLVGIVLSVKTSNSGYTFDICDSFGNKIHCYCRDKPISNETYLLSGTYSDDRSIFFAQRMTSSND